MALLSATVTTTTTGNDHNNSVVAATSSASAREAAAILFNDDDNEDFFDRLYSSSKSSNQVSVYGDSFFDDPPEETLRVVMQNGHPTDIAMHDSYEMAINAGNLYSDSDEDSDLKVYRVLIRDASFDLELESRSRASTTIQFHDMDDDDVTSSTDDIFPINPSTSPKHYPSTKTITFCLYEDDESHPVDCTRLGSAKSEQLLREHCQSREFVRPKSLSIS